MSALGFAAACGTSAGAGGSGGAASNSAGNGPGGSSANTGGVIVSGGRVGQSGSSAAGSGGSLQTGGVVGTGGITPMGDASGTGGVAATGGNGDAGRMSIGGASSGSPGAGGATSGGGGTLATGGTPGSGGTNATAGKGGTSSTGAASATGGESATGGTGGTSGAYRPCPTNGTACKIMPFGDSITDGYGTAGGYRVELFRLAHQASKNITFVGTGSNGPGMVDGVAFPANHEGHSGFTIDQTPSRSGISPLVATVMPQFTPHIVLLMIGTNDAIDDYQLTAAPTRLGALIDSIFTRLPNVLMIVAQPIPSQDDALNTRIQSYNAAIPAVVKSRTDAGKHILLVDMYAPFAEVSSYKTTLLKDTWHPNEAGHAILGGRWYSVLAPSL